MNYTQEIYDLKRQVQQLKAQIQHLVMPMAQTETTNEQSLAEVQLAYTGGTSSLTTVLQNYGFTSRPLAGSTHAVINFGGMAGNGASIASNDERYRPTTMAEGDSIMHDNTGQYLWLNNGNVVIFTNGSFTINAMGDGTITTPNLTINANIATTGTLTNNGHDVGSTHKHTNTQTGSGLSGVPQ